MGLRFRRSVRLAPGIRMNFSGSGVSWTLGPRGASIGIGKRGTYINSGIPGTGLYFREKVGSSPKSNIVHRSTHSKVPVSVEVSDDGTLLFRDANGNPLSANLVNAAKKQQGEAIRGLIKKTCEEINTQIEEIGNLHFYTPNPNVKPQYQSQAFEKPQPTKPIPIKPGLFGLIFKFKRERIEIENYENDRLFEKELSMWQEEKEQFDKTERYRKDIIERGIYDDVEVMESFLEETLQNIIWPRETVVSIEILNKGNSVFVDVDLPEIEDMPNKIASVPQRGYRLSVKEMSAIQIQRLYMRHIHGIGFRIIGEVFGSLPNAQQVVLSAYSQRPDRSTGHIKDEYLYSVRVDRSSWSRINFDNLQQMDIVEALSQFDIKRDMTKTGGFKAIEPFGPDLL